MASRLKDIQPGEVSLVRRGANRRPFLFAKADEGDFEIDGDIAEVLQKTADTEAALLDALRAAGADESVLKAAAGIARLTEAVRDAFGENGIPDAVRKAMDACADDDGEEDDDDDELELSKAAAARETEIYKRDFTDDQRKDLAAKGHALPNGSYPIETKADIGPAVTLASSGHGDVDAAKTLIKRRAKELGAEDQLPDSWVTKEDEMAEATVPVRKEDGTWDLSSVPEEQRDLFEQFAKAHDDELAELRKQSEEQKSEAIQKAETAEKIAKQERDHRELREAIAKSAELDHLAKDDSEFGPVLRDIAKAEADGNLPDGTAAKLDEVLAAANEAVEKGDLFKEQGRVGFQAGEGSAIAKVDAAADKLREADSSLSKEQAFAKALENDPSLYDEIKKEQA